MSEGVSLIIWPTTAKYSLISLWFYVLCQKLRKHCNGISILKRAYLHNQWFKLYELKSIRKPRRSTLLSLCNAKWDFHTIKHHTANNPKLPNIAMLSEPTIYGLGPGLLYGILPGVYYSNYCKLVYGMQLMNQHNISLDNVCNAYLALVSFTWEFEEYTVNA